MKRRGRFRCRLFERQLRVRPELSVRNSPRKAKGPAAVGEGCGDERRRVVGGGLRGGGGAMRHVGR